ncbi:MAG: hypothetical protein ACTSQB_00030 [Candidatus Heimdallarchaeota archaeon]
MNRKTRKILIFTLSIILALGLYGFVMFGLADFNDPDGTNPLGLRIDDTDDDSRVDHPFIPENSTFRDVGRAVGFVLWEAKGVDIIIVGFILLIASESAATVVKGFEDQCSEFRQEMCDTDKFVILERKDADELEEQEDD